MIEFAHQNLSILIIYLIGSISAKNQVKARACLAPSPSLEYLSVITPVLHRHRGGQHDRDICVASIAAKGVEREEQMSS